MNRPTVVVLVIFLVGFDKCACNLDEDLREFENLVNVNSVVQSYLTFLQYEQFRQDIEFLKTNQGFKGFVDALKKSFPEEQFTALIESKLQASKDFQEMYGNLMSEEYRTLYARCMNTVQGQLMTHYMQTKNIDLEDLLDVIRYLSGWGRLI
ncbi:PpMVP1 [Anopheles sinensis]|uniref:PpMVP1 n=1 Tax=Anopheles sinensis TaxID=74873 RepID=A0A084W5J5_ANOSI|nr:PpMVP1 [Anopheles sinensis]